MPPIFYPTLPSFHFGKAQYGLSDLATGNIPTPGKVKKTAAILPKVAVSPVAAAAEVVGGAEKGGKAEYEEGGGERQKFRHAGKETPLSAVLKKFGSYRKTFKHKDAEIETAHHPDMTPQDHKILAEAHRDLQSHYADKVNHHLGVRPSDNTAMAHGKAAEHHESLSGKSGQ